MTTAGSTIYDVIIIGGGQTALAAAYYLRRTNFNYLILDSETQPGGAWQHCWASLALFSPAQWSSLPGVLMPGGQHYYPTRGEFLQYLQAYEARYHFPVVRPVKVTAVHKEGDIFELTTTAGNYFAKTVISATGIYTNPYTPQIPGMDVFQGALIHASQYQEPAPFTGLRVAIVGEGNSGAQILAEISQVAETVWITRKPPEFLPDDIDGKDLFDAATQQYKAQQQGKDYQPLSIGKIVMVPSVKEARERGVYENALPPFDHFYEAGLAWSSGWKEPADAVIFCTGYKPALSHLAPLNIIPGDGKIQTQGTRATAVDGLWLMGYGSWTGFASATIIGVGRTARQTITEITDFLQ
ncbi:MAG: NAD(P)/FAD-dependent oxidoreductase [Chitinophaga sp.]|uniref:ArsO family NAD(P)H-dependent flavin-containing monooxygenase n=1 Tax=Chitinophaga sp. TaxID=1869181 RepID=UPI001B0ADB10|nr:ArsO family NAD(P)H-dependent flavin-containing monooxygenase [Chitinophaga sp.]MBO9730670.1 NAD(P)/FAD-dependent oxidoreductase [Chitinophaga sp.]